MIKLDEQLSLEFAPVVLPHNWKEAPSPLHAWERADGLKVVFSVERVYGEPWVHASASRAGRLPSWEDMQEVKALFVGRKRKAIMVLPSDDEYVNHAPFVLHLWHCLSREIVPDLRRMGTL